MPAENVARTAAFEAGIINATGRSCQKEKSRRTGTFNNSKKLNLFLFSGFPFSCFLFWSGFLFSCFFLCCHFLEFNV